MAALLRAHHHLPAAEFIRVAYESVVDFSAGTRQADDLTAVVVKRLPK
jgi:serine phosphatase RsbU (regulator of sigma subunit)